LPEPYLSRLVDEAGGRLLVDESTLWPKGQFVTAELIVTTKLLNAHPDVVRHLIEGEATATDWANTHPTDAQQVINTELTRLTGKALSARVLADAWTRLTFTLDPLASALQTAARSAETAGLLTSNTSLNGIFDLRTLNTVLRSSGRQPVGSAGLGPT